MLREPAKPTYEELKERVQQLEAEVAELRKAEASYRKEESTIREVEKIALLGHWQLDMVSGTLYWSEEIFDIFDISPGEFEATYEAFLNTIHPHDREYVDRAYTESLKNKTGYDIVHRLLLRDGRVKYVREKCRTEYDEDGKPLRSLGTVQDITDRVRAQQTFSGIIGRDPKMRELFDAIRELSNINVPVYIQGESGTGKELVASAIHNEGPRAREPFVPVNCSALPEGLLESELFGHVKGAFTGAIRDKRGRFELADGGTLFLDEVADLPKSVQVKLLRVLQEGKFERVGDEKSISVDVRIISAANRDLRTEVDRGNFRADLFYRIRVVPLLLPPLRERSSDIPLLVDHFVECMAREGQHTEGISKEVIPLLLDYCWPGNIRELQSALRYALIKSKGGLIQPEHLPEEVKSAQSASTACESNQPRDSEGIRDDFEENRGEKPGRVKLDRISVMDALNKAGGNKTRAADILRVGRATLYRYLNDNPL
ncbi:MAG: sigma 54-interacting transcriptional regulator [Deltaproteobacteria bacterium]|nr:sigma 54-interacting transcriptional regulator [Deltaproteobacteria bacterium]